MKFTTAIAAVIALQGADARMGLGKCPDIQWDTGFDSAKFAGDWYEIKRDNWMGMDMGQMCTTGTYRARADGAMDVQYRTLFPVNMDMEVLKYGQSPVMKMDCSQSFECKFTIESA